MSLSTTTTTKAAEAVSPSQNGDDDQSTVCVFMVFLYCIIQVLDDCLNPVCICHRYTMMMIVSHKNGTKFIYVWNSSCFFLSFLLLSSLCVILAITIEMSITTTEIHLLHNAVTFFFLYSSMIRENVIDIVNFDE